MNLHDEPVPLIFYGRVTHATPFRSACSSRANLPAVEVSRPRLELDLVLAAPPVERIDGLSVVPVLRLKPQTEVRVGAGDRRLRKAVAVPKARQVVSVGIDDAFRCSDSVAIFNGGAGGDGRGAVAGPCMP